MSRVVFTGGRFHRYAIDGKRAPSPTTVVNKALAKPGLVMAAAKEAAIWAVVHHEELGQLGEYEWRHSCQMAHRRVWDQARDNGTKLHALAEQLVFGNALPTEDADGLPWPDDIYASAEQLARFFDAWQVDPVVHEAIVFHERHWWAGRLNLIADLGDGRRWLLDYTTGASGVWPEKALQLSAYRHATHLVNGTNDVPMPEVGSCAVVWVRPDGWELVPVKADDHAYEMFLHCLALEPWADQKRDEVVGAPLAVPEGGAA